MDTIQINNLQQLIKKLDVKNKEYSARINELNTKIDRDKYYDLIKKYENEIVKNDESIAKMQTQIIFSQKAKRDVSNNLSLEKDLEALETAKQEQILTPSSKPMEYVKEENEGINKPISTRLDDEYSYEEPISPLPTTNELLSSEESEKRYAAEATGEKISKKQARRERRRETRRKTRRLKKEAKTSRRAEKIALGKSFRSTLTQKKIVKPINTNPNIICKAILQSGKNMTKKKYYLPSQFPNLTKLKPMIQSKETK